MPGVKWLIINAQLCICNAKVATGATAALPKHLMRRMRNILQCKLAKYRQMQSSLKDVYEFDCFIHQNIKISHFIHLALRAWQLQLSMIIQELSSFNKKLFLHFTPPLSPLYHRLSFSLSLFSFASVNRAEQRTPK